MVKRFFIGIVLTFAQFFTECAARCNDVADSLSTGETVAEVKKRRKNGENNDSDVQ